MTELHKRITTSLILISILTLAFNYNLALFMLLILINFFSLIEFKSIFKKIFKNNNFMYFLVMIMALLYMITFSLTAWYYFVIENEYHKIAIILLIIICVATDIGGFVFGKIIGGKKFSRISPNKTYSGISGSFIFSLIFGLIFYINFDQLLILNTNIIILILLISFISQCGDLLISLIKRKAKIKDTGSVLPGHGGILDRIDGILLALPFGMFIMFL